MSDPTVAEWAHSFRITVARLARRLRAERIVDSITDGQFAVLATLRTSGEQTLSELALRERVSAPSMTRTVNNLEAAGYVVRDADGMDGRKILVSLTVEGRRIVDATVQRRDAWTEDALAELSDDELEVLAQVLPLLERIASR